LATLAVLDVVSDGVPWVLTGQVPFDDLASALRDMLNERDSYPQVFEAITDLARHSPPGEPWDQSLGLILAALIRGHRGIMAMLEVVRRFSELADGEGRDLGAVLRNAIVSEDPDMAVIIPKAVMAGADSTPAQAGA
jgi:hypothetical protein